MDSTSKYKVDKYAVFSTEMRAIRLWLELVGSYKFYTFMREYVGIDLRNSIFDIPPLTKAEKVKYLANMGLNVRTIANTLKASPITVKKILEEDKNVRFTHNNLVLDSIISHWNKVRSVFPNEIFINYLKKE